MVQSEQVERFKGVRVSFYASSQLDNAYGRDPSETWDRSRASEPRRKLPVVDVAVSIKIRFAHPVMKDLLGFVDLGGVQ